MHELWQPISSTLARKMKTARDYTFRSTKREKGEEKETNERTTEQRSNDDTQANSKLQ